MTINNFEVIISCKKCGSTNIQMEKELDYASNIDWHDTMENTENIEIKCKDCNNFDILYI